MEIQKYYKIKGKEIVDILFEGQVFNPKITRDSMNFLEDLLAFYLESEADTQRRLARFHQDWEKTLQKPKEEVE